MASLIPARVRLPFDFDPEPLAAELERIGAGDWIGHRFRTNYEGVWDILPLRAPAGEAHPIRQAHVDPGATRFSDTAWLERLPAFRAAIARFDCPLRSVRLMRLAAGSTILEHVDDLDAEVGILRLHVPVTTNPEVDFRLGGRRVEMAPGSVWYLRLSEPHSVANRGSTDRVHLVLDAAVNAWLMRMLREGKSVSDTEFEPSPRT